MSLERLPCFLLEKCLTRRPRRDQFRTQIARAVRSAYVHSGCLGFWMGVAPVVRELSMRADYLGGACQRVYYSSIIRAMPQYKGHEAFSRIRR